MKTFNVDAGGLSYEISFGYGSYDKGHLKIVVFAGGEYLGELTRYVKAIRDDHIIYIPQEENPLIRDLFIKEFAGRSNAGKRYSSKLKTGGYKVKVKDGFEKEMQKYKG